ncbi:MAG TPA: hypothetical protein VFM71_04105 [Gemmatimonadaceae bacterium]|nr:hypothetical protein [Gemmatimonadaceae bacterium]
MRTLRIVLVGALSAAAALGAPAGAQQAPKPTDEQLVQPIVIQYFRPQDQRGINMFETSKEAGAPFEGFRLQWGAAFTQQFQSLSHSNTADSVPTAAPGNLTDRNRLKEIGSGFNNAVANLYMHAQIAPGVRIQLTSYLSSRHHNETWVKDGFIQVDESPLDVPLLHDLMKFTTLKVGHFQVNYGDMQFRRSDNGQAMYNPFVGNALMDAFSTEIGTEVIFQRHGLLGVVAATNGESRGRVDLPDDRAPAYMAKLGFDRQLNEDLRVRLTGSYRTQESAAGNVLYAGDRAGSRYYMVMENSAATESAQFTSGRVNPGFRDNSTSYVINPFVKFGDAEFFGMYESAKGKGQTETVDREVKQYMAEGLYRMLDDRLYVGARWNAVEGEVLTAGPDVTVTRTNVGGGWFVTPTLMMKVEYVDQRFTDFPPTDIRNGGRFKGFMLEGVVAF